MKSRVDAVMLYHFLKDENVKNKGVWFEKMYAYIYEPDAFISSVIITDDVVIEDPVYFDYNEEKIIDGKENDLLSLTRGDAIKEKNNVFEIDSMKFISEVENAYNSIAKRRKTISEFYGEPLTLEVYPAKSRSRLQNIKVSDIGKPNKTDFKVNTEYLYMALKYFFSDQFTVTGIQRKDGILLLSSCDSRKFFIYYNDGLGQQDCDD